MDLAYLDPFKIAIVQSLTEKTKTSDSDVGLSVVPSPSQGIISRYFSSIFTLTYVTTLHNDYLFNKSCRYVSYLLLLYNLEESIHISCTFSLSLNNRLLFRRTRSARGAIVKCCQIRKQRGCHFLNFWVIKIIFCKLYASSTACKILFFVCSLCCLCLCRAHSSPVSRKWWSTPPPPLKGLTMALLTTVGSVNLLLIGQTKLKGKLHNT